MNDDKTLYRKRVDSHSVEAFSARHWARHSWMKDVAAVKRQRPG